MKNELRIPILNDEYVTIVTWGTYTEVAKVLKKYYYIKDDLELMAESFYGKLRGVCFHREGLMPVLCLPCFPSDPDEIATLAHEACHAIEYIFGCINATDEEIFAHSVAAIVRKVLEKRNDV